MSEKDDRSKPCPEVYQFVYIFLFLTNVLSFYVQNYFTRTHLICNLKDLASKDIEKNFCEEKCETRKNYFKEVQLPLRKLQESVDFLMVLPLSILILDYWKRTFIAK